MYKDSKYDQYSTVEKKHQYNIGLVFVECFVLLFSSYEKHCFKAKVKW